MNYSHHFGFLLLCASLLSSPSVNATPLTDGPYVFHRDGKREAQWICAGEVKTQRIDAGGQVDALCGDVPRLQLQATHQTAADTLPQPERWAALSDIHGQAGLFLQLLQAQRIIDDAGQWAWGDGVLVITGDVFDRGPSQLEALWAIYRLAQQAAAAGGRVELLLGNHEVMVLGGDLRYLHPRYLDVATSLGRSYDRLFAADTQLGAWLRRRATVLRLGDTLFMHGGLHPKFADTPIDLAAINNGFRSRIGASRETLKSDPDADRLFGSDGPIWYRGYFLPMRASSEQIDALLAAAQVDRIVVGHTTQTEVRPLYQGRVIGIDAAMKDGERGELLIWQRGQLWRGLMDGQQLSLPSGDDDGTTAQASN